MPETPDGGWDLDEDASDPNGQLRFDEETDKPKKKFVKGIPNDVAKATNHSNRFK